MLMRFSIALMALYLVHGSGHVAGDSARIAADLGKQVPQAAVAYCVDNPDPCRKALRQAASLATPEAPPSTTLQIPVADTRAAIDTYPLPPRRPQAGTPKKA